MHAAQVTAWGEPPKYVELPTPSPPAADLNLVQLKILAVGVHRITLSRAAGKHYSATQLPHRPGWDGVGEVVSAPNAAQLSVGTRVYFLAPATEGSMAEYVNVPVEDVVPIPKGADPVQIAALMNPSMSSWMSLKTRTKGLPKDFTVLIVGATSASGQIGISLARQLGAGKVIGVARNLETLNSLPLDQAIQLKDPVEKTDFSTLGNIDVILDYVYGPATSHLFQNLRNEPGRETQYVHIGSLSSLTMDLHGALLRSKNLTIRGSGPGSWTMLELHEQLAEMVRGAAGLEKMSVKVVKFQDVETSWKEAGGKTRIVFVP